MADPESIKVPPAFLQSNPVSESLPELAEAHATAQVLRATARVVRAERGALGFRLNRAADALDSMVALAVRYLQRIEQLEQEQRQLTAARGAS